MSQELELRIDRTRSEVAAIVVRDQASMTMANRALLGIKELLREIKDTFKPIYDKQKAATQETKDKWDQFRVPLEMDESRLKTAICSFKMEEERKAREAAEKARLESAAIARAEAEKLRLAEEIRAREAAPTIDADQDAEEIAQAKKSISEIRQTVAAIPPAQWTPPAKLKTEGISMKMIPDLEKIRAAVDASRGQIEIPGVLVVVRWDVKIENSELIPAEYRKPSLAARIGREAL